MSETRMFSLGKAIREIVEHGALTGTERTVHFELQREAESCLNEFRWMRGANGRDIGLNVPLEYFTRQVTVAGFPIGVETFGISNLLTWSACLRAGATVLTGLSRNSTLWSIGTLPVPEWLPESAWLCHPIRRFPGTPLLPNGSYTATFAPRGSPSRLREYISRQLRGNVLW
jgi:hypothetical protein